MGLENRNRYAFWLTKVRQTAAVFAIFLVIYRYLIFVECGEATARYSSPHPYMLQFVMGIAAVIGLTVGWGKL